MKRSRMVVFELFNEELCAGNGINRSGRRKFSIQMYQYVGYYDSFLRADDTGDCVYCKRSAHTKSPEHKLSHSQ